MTALKIILGIIFFFLILLSIKVKINFHSEDGIDLSIKWLFIKIGILPKKKKKKPNKKKKEKPKKEKEEEKPKEKKEKKENILVRFYHNNGVSGVIELLNCIKKVLGSMMGRLAKAFTIEELYISLIVGSSDSAETANKYGKTCAEFYPVMGYVVDNMHVKKYSAEVIPDFINGTNKARLHGSISIIPQKLIHAVICLVFEAVFKVVIKLFKGAKQQNVPDEKSSEKTAVSETAK